MPALPLDEAGKYVAGAYLAFLALLLVYRDHGREAAADRPRAALLAELAEERRDEGETR